MTRHRRLEGKQTILRIYFGESDRVKRKPFSDYVVERARVRGMAGCTVMRAITGFGANSIVRTASVLALSVDLPLVVEIVDERALIDGLLEELESGHAGRARHPPGGRGEAVPRPWRVNEIDAAHEGGTNMEFTGRAKRVRIYVNEGDVAHHKPVHVAVLELLRANNTAGATVLRAIEGFGGSGQIHTTRVVDTDWRLPIVIEWIDTADRVARLLPALKQLVQPGLITVDDTEVVLFSPSP